MNFIDQLFVGRQLQIAALSPLPAPTSQLPPGWMSDLELTLLYNLALHGDGDFLEIGSWVGRSSAAIAMGMRDAGKPGRRLDIVDLGLTSAAEFATKLNAKNPDYLLRDEITRPLLAPGGIVGGLIENLRSRELLPFATSIIRGDAAEVPLRTSYEVVFCDATHNESEIAVTGPVLARVARRGGWLMCDDLSEPALLTLLATHVDFQFTVRLAELDPKSKAVIGRIRPSP